LYRPKVGTLGYMYLGRSKDARHIDKAPALSDRLGASRVDAHAVAVGLGGDLRKPSAKFEAAYGEYVQVAQLVVSKLVFRKPQQSVKGLLEAAKNIKIVAAEVESRMLMQTYKRKVGVLCDYVMKENDVDVLLELSSGGASYFAECLEQESKFSSRLAEGFPYLVQAILMLKVCCLQAKKAAWLDEVLVNDAELSSLVSECACRLREFEGPASFLAI